MASCLSGAGGRTYGFDFDFVKSPSTTTSTLTSPTSSPASTISETSNSPRAISTKKPRTPRKRPNQTYNEAATLLSTAYPDLFSTKNLKKPQGKFTKPTTEASFFEESSELLLPFRVHDTSSFLLHHHHHQQPIQHKPSFQTEPKVLNLQENPCQRVVNSHELDDDCREDFDCESILDEEMEEGIDSIMGSRVEEDSNGVSCHVEGASPWFGFGGKLGFRTGVRALRRVDDGNWWNFPAVDILEISPGMKNPPAVAFVPATEKKKKNKKKEKVEKPNVEQRDSELVKGNSITKSNQGLLLKLNYEEVRNAWSNRGSPFGSGVPENDVIAQMALLAENGGVREASVLRYKEKRRTRLSSKKFIRYQVRKDNADQRPRMKVPSTPKLGKWRMKSVCIQTMKQF